MGRKNKKAAKPQKESSHPVTNHHSKQVICFEGENLVQLLKSIQREIESARNLDGGLPDKIWVKQFSIGVNDVTRVLERMPPVCSTAGSSNPVTGSGNIKDTRLQAILLASDCYPQMLTKHLPSLASLKNVPLIYVKDKRRGSLRLGDLVQLKTAIALGIKIEQLCDLGARWWLYRIVDIEGSYIYTSAVLRSFYQLFVFSYISNIKRPLYKLDDYRYMYFQKKKVIM
ncbi:uncharacterized protein LOC108211890 isoform X2 [Daucus carota subsp. sativus]|uniref:uncharacterized protein LOC108211890 isoform X2 n=1 Tax=Daucus carota subsp. sativus TaxID=79200 RepID=UPI0030829103